MFFRLKTNVKVHVFEKLKTKVMILLFSCVGVCVYKHAFVHCEAKKNLKNTLNEANSTP